MRKNIPMLFFAHAGEDRVKKQQVIKSFFGNRYNTFLLFLLGFHILLHVSITNVPADFLFDSAYYIPACRAMLAGQGDTNLAHPSLSKVFIALSIKMFGDCQLGWRFFSITFGMLSLVTIYFFVKKMTNNYNAALTSVVLLSFENLFWIHSGIAMLDIYMLVFITLSFLCYSYGNNRLSSVSLALGALCKLTAVYGLVVIIGYHTISFIRNIKKRESIKRKVKELGAWIAIYSSTFLVLFILGLLILDLAFTPFSSPIDHLKYMWSVYGSLTRTAGPMGIGSYPWTWWFPYWLVQPIPYYVVRIVVGGVVSYPIHFLGVISPVIAYSTVPSMIYVFWDYTQNNNSFALFVLSWFLGTYLPWFLWAFLNKVTYVYYALPSVEAVCCAMALALTNKKLPMLLLVVFMVAVLVNFFILFPCTPWIQLK